MIITRNQAICMLFYVDYSVENAKKCEKKIEDLGDFEICYNVDPKQPILVSIQRIRGDPLTYRTYLHSSDIPDKSLKRKRIEFQTEIQVIQFINEVYLPEEPQNTNIYDMKSVSTADIYDTVRKHTVIFENKSVLSFSRWCSNARLSFLRAQEERKNNIRVRSCYVMDEQFHDDIKSAICQFLPLYQESIKNLKRNGFEIVGYARKSPSNDKNENRVKLLQKMVDNLQSRSLTTRIYVSFSSCASTPFSERDTTTNKSMIAKLSNVNGDTQDRDICLVSIDYAGLTSRPQELNRLIENNDKIKKIAIDTFALDNEIHLFDTKLLVSDPTLLTKFDCRKKILQRSK
ncbi:uncharacterized protein RHIMIDRAFT_316939 [Rhizopus microsporus ATCC 52813]|uniref:Uncharacterized protein n=1 Tax=Rhizopus microsporus ATCC 52813 TaxID=1340429 RepID=A0A2G4SEG8_RHIZD|nr:uncharacterized protein RHIMIDRAFT_316939 [Rhizopus microsporus ATCC 52813]PHZ07179.1 hypothetical protein RHIMIDRAFT_316939 [Rhizopus microsporus ATCC 52813]